MQIITFRRLRRSGWLALRTRTAALSSVFTVLTFLLTIAIAGDFGLRQWIDDGRWDAVALALVPLLAGYAALGGLAERSRRPWLSRPLYLGSALLLIAALELLALHGRAFHYLGFSLAALHERQVSDPVLLDTLAAMTMNGVVYLAWRRSTRVRLDRAQILSQCRAVRAAAPARVSGPTNEYSLRFDWLYAAPPQSCS